MNIRIKSVFILICSVLIVSCGNEDEAEMSVILSPEAMFSTEYSNVTIGEPLLLSNNSTNATWYEWDFGDGNTSFSKNPIHSYGERGKYLVSLKAFNASDTISETSIEVTVGRRRLTGLFLLESANELPSNLIFFFGEVDNPDNSYLAAFPGNVSAQSLPFGGNINFGVTVFLTDNNWFWMLIDNQEPVDSFDENDRLIFGSRVNSARTLGNRYNNNSGEFVIDETKNSDGQITNDYKMRVVYDFIN